jgi:hypothetical protein
VATWGGFEDEAPDLAAAGRSLWQRNGLMYLATIRRDGRPRLHPVAPFLAVDKLIVAISHRSPKWRDLERDPRCVLHCLPGDRDDEFSLQCRAAAASDPRDRLSETAGHVIHADDHLFEMDIEQADHAWWEHVGRPGTYPVRRRWTAPPSSSTGT